MMHFLRHVSFLCILALLLGGCAPAPNAPQPDQISGSATKIPQQTQPGEINSNPLPTVTVTPAPPVITVNPLTGLPVQDPSLLNLPAVLVSIAHFPPAARPQAGLSYAPFVFEVYITEGATRFLTAFYGEFPAPEPVVTGDCAVRTTPFVQTDLILGNRIWLDTNGDQLEDAWERGVGGVCVNLYDVNNNLLQQTTTDSNGYYGFNVTAGEYVVEVVKPQGMEFVQRKAGAETQDSDVDQATGRGEAVAVRSTLLTLDAGLLLLNAPEPSSKLAPPYVGPVRSGRLVYADIAGFFARSCLIFAYASSEVLVELPKCAFVDHILQGGGYMLEIDEMKRLAEERKDANTPLTYASNTFAADAPGGGQPAERLNVFMAWLNQSAWQYDAASQSYWRYVDNANPDTAGVLHPEVDRLNQRQLQFENVMVLFAYHDVVSPTNLDIHLEQDWVGDALLFRDGRVYPLRWSTRATEAEISSGIHKPIQFYYPDEKTLFPLKPGRTWITIVTPQTTVTEKSPGIWTLQFSQPPGAK